MKWADSGGGPSGSGGGAPVGHIGIPDWPMPASGPPMGRDGPPLAFTGRGAAGAAARARSSSLPWANWHFRPYGHSPVFDQVAHRTVL